MEGQEDERGGGGWPERETTGRETKGDTLTVSQASRHAGRGERVTLLRVHELADGGKLVDFSVSRGAGAIGGLRRHRSPEAGERRLQAVTITGAQQHSEIITNHW